MKLIMGLAPCGMMKILIPLFMLLFLKNSPPQNIAGPTMILCLPPLLNYSLLGASVPTSMIYLDKLALSLIILTLWVSALMLLTLPPQKDYPANLMIILLAFFLLLAFSTSNILIFYIFFEASLIPTIIIILTWGGQPERINAAMYFFLYTFISSLLLLLILFLWSSSSYTLYMHNPLPHTSPIMMSSAPLWGLLVMMPFLVKVPIYSLHLWLPKAHVEAPLIGSMILASILLKLGGYGLIRLNKLLSGWNQTELIKPFIFSLAIMGTVMTSFACLNQADMKALIAYSSVAHMGPMLASIMTMTRVGEAAAIVIMIAHGLTSSCLFVLANEAYSNSGSRSLALNKGTLHLLPYLSLAWILLLATNMSTPPSLNFFGEIAAIPPLLLMSPASSLIITMGIFLTGAYSLLLFSNATHGLPNSMVNSLSPPSAKTTFIILMHFAPLLPLPLALSMMM